MPRRRQPVYVEDTLTVLIESFGYIVDGISGNGIVLIKEGDHGRHAFPIALPFGTETIPDEVLEHVFSRADFDMPTFWAALDQYLKA